MRFVPACFALLAGSLIALAGGVIVLHGSTETDTEFKNELHAGYDFISVALGDEELDITWNDGSGALRTLILQNYEAAELVPPEYRVLGTWTNENNEEFQLVQKE